MRSVVRRRLAGALVILGAVVAPSKIPSAPPALPGGRRGPSRLLIGVVSVATVVAGLLTWLLVREAGAPHHPPTPDGGMLVLTDGPRASLGHDAIRLAAEISDTGYAGEDRMEVTLAFPSPRPGLHWVLAASGQYATSRAAPADAFCRVGFGRAGSAGDVTCDADGADGGPVRIRRRHELASTSPDGLYRVDDYVGYQAGSASTISGVLPDSVRGRGPITFTVAWPIAELKTAEGGSSTYGALAPIAADDFEYGSADKLSSRDLSRLGEFVDIDELVPLNHALVSSVSFELTQSLGYEDVAHASPATVGGDALRWTDPAIAADGMSYILHDPIAEGNLLRNTFLGGVLGGLAVSTLLWVVQMAIERREARRR